MSDCTLLILTYKGKHHLEYLLPTVRNCIEQTLDYKIDVLIVDNGCHEPTRDFVLQNFPEFRYEFSPVNDYLFSLNTFVEKIESQFVFILNDDMKLHSEVLNYTLPIIKKDEKLFAVTCNVTDWEGTISTAFVRELFYKRGWLYSRWNKENKDEKIRYTLYGGGGAAIFRTKVFNQLKGFDDLYRPAYCEDLDIGHKAWHQGYRIVYQPKAILYHREGGTINNQFKADKLTQKIYKNQILWMVRNGNHPKFLTWFLLLLPYRILTGWRVDKNSYIALLKSLSKIPKALFRRSSSSKSKVNDKEIMKILNTEYKV